MRPCSSSPLVLQQIAHIIGVVVSEIIMDTKTAVDESDGKFAEEPANDSAHHRRGIRRQSAKY